MGVGESGEVVGVEAEVKRRDDLVVVSEPGDGAMYNS
jgi:hypothetical protein